MPLSLAITGLSEESLAEIDASGGALNPDQVYFQYLCTTASGHDPNESPDEKTRPSHAALHGTVWRIDDPGAPIPPVDWGCFLPGTEIVGIVDGASCAHYTGQAVEIRTKSGRVLRVTPNHPIATPDGLIAAGLIKEGGKVLSYLPYVVPVALEHVGENNTPPSAQEIFDLAAKCWRVSATYNSRDHFHGDGAAINGNIQVAGSYALLADVINAEIRKDAGHHDFVRSLGPLLLPESRLALHGSNAGALALEGDASRRIGGSDLSLPGGSIHAGPFDDLGLGGSPQPHPSARKSSRDNAASGAETLGYRIDGIPLDVVRDHGGDINWGQMGCLSLGNAPRFDACLYEPDANGLGLNPVFFTEILGRSSGQIFLDDIVHVSALEYSGHVYDFRSPLGWVVGGGIVTSNCRCAIRYVSAPRSTASEILPPAPSAPVADPTQPARKWLDENVDGWRKIAEAAAKVPPQQAEQAAFAAAKKIGASRDIARLALRANPLPTPTPQPLGLDPLAGIGRAGRALAARFLAGDAQAGAELAKKYPETYRRLLREGDFNGPA